jgi:hypothetical protein
MAGVATIGYSDLIRRICDHALAKRGENYMERWVKTLRLSGLGGNEVPVIYNAPHGAGVVHA